MLHSLPHVLTPEPLPHPMQLALDDLGDLEDGGPARPWYKRWGFWLSALSFAASLAFFVAGIVMVVVSPDTVNVWLVCCGGAAPPAALHAPAGPQQQEAVHAAAWLSIWAACDPILSFTCNIP